MQHKVKYLLQLIEQLGEHRDMAIQAAQKAQQDANEHKGAMESRYDTFKEESQYLSAAQQLRTATLEQAIFDTDRLAHSLEGLRHDIVRVGSIVTVRDDDDIERNYFIVPYSLGIQHLIAGQSTIIIGKDSPIASALLGASVGDELEVALPKGLNTYYVVSIG